MKRLMNTLYVASKGAYLRKDGETIAVEIDGRVAKRTPVHLLGQIVLFGQTVASPDVLEFATRNCVSIVWMGWSGKLLARVEGPQSGNVLLRRAQHRATADTDAALSVALAMAAAQIAHKPAVLRRHLRDYPDHTGAENVDAAQHRLSVAARHSLHAPNLDILRGQEGEAGRAYWHAFRYLIRADEPAM